MVNQPRDKKGRFLPKPKEVFRYSPSGQIIFDQVELKPKKKVVLL